MRDLVILGTEVHACEMAEIVERVNRAEPTWRLLGFIASGADAPAGDVNGYPVLGTPGAMSAYPQAGWGFSSDHSPSCFKKNGTPAAWHWSLTLLAHSGCIGRALVPVSPP